MHSSLWYKFKPSLQKKPIEPTAQFGFSKKTINFVRLRCVAVLTPTLEKHINVLFNNKYRIPSARLQNWNYANEAMYFITICTKNRENYFGEIVDADDVPSQKTRYHPSDHPPSVETRCIASLRPTEIGKIAHSEWYKTIELRPDMNIELGEFVVMPNHIHGIIIIGANEYNSITAGGGKFGVQSKNLASIVRGYKSAVTTYARKNGIEFDWQARFHDHIIRSMEEYRRISNYIINNPVKWLQDRFYQK